jgi:hypothetical protein
MLATFPCSWSGFNFAVCVSIRVISRLCCSLTTVNISTYPRHGRDHRYTDTANRSPMVRSPALNPCRPKLPNPGVSATHFTLTFKNPLVKWCTNSLTFSNSSLCPRCIYVFCIYLRTNSDLCHLQHKLTGFYNRDMKCLQRGTDWVFK